MMRSKHCAFHFALALAAALPACTPAARPKNAVLIVLDTLRADRLSAYGNPRPTSPVLDALARDGALFETVVSNAPWTLPAMVGLMTGEYPTARTYDAGLRRSLALELQAAGYATVAFTEGAFVSKRYGFDLGFREFREHEGSVPFLLSAPGEDPEAGGDRGIEKTFGWAKSWLAEHARERPFFLLVHSYEPHVPYRRRTFAEGMPRGRLGPTFEAGSAITAKRSALSADENELAYIRALYDGGVAACDRSVGELLAELERLGVAQETLVVVTSDHGEDLGDRLPLRPGNHGHALYDEQLRVPLIVRDPTRAFAVRRVAAQVRLVDVMPTILDLLGLPASPDRIGRSLVPLLDGAESEPRLAWSEIPHHALIDPGVRWSVRTGSYKLILTPPPPGGSAQLELYDLRADAQERSNLAARDPARRAELMQQLRSLSRELNASGAAVYREASEQPDPALQERLRSLGYVE
ncbi:MAG TPA: sulfatase [Myxococcota bacterium]|jgi:arylsulfatase A-like enzyme